MRSFLMKVLPFLVWSRWKDLAAAGIVPRPWATSLGPSPPWSSPPARQVSSETPGNTWATQEKRRQHRRSFFSLLICHPPVRRFPHRLVGSNDIACKPKPCWLTAEVVLQKRVAKWRCYRDRGEKRRFGFRCSPSSIEPPLLQTAACHQPCPSLESAPALVPAPLCHSSLLPENTNLSDCLQLAVDYCAQKSKEDN